MRVWVLVASLLLAGCSRTQIFQYHIHTQKTHFEEPSTLEQTSPEEKAAPVPPLEEIPSHRLDDKDYVIERLLDHIDRLNAYIEEHHRPP
jgi:hypothetical protein